MVVIIQPSGLIPQSSANFEFLLVPLFLACLNMSTKISFLRECRWAELAGVGFLLSVRRHVDLQSAFLIESFLTLGALERPLS